MILLLMQAGNPEDTNTVEKASLFNLLCYIQSIEVSEARIRSIFKIEDDNYKFFVLEDTK